MLTEDNLSSATTQIGGGLAQSVPILPGSWDVLTTKLHDVTSGMSRPPAGYQPEFEVIYRDRLASHVQTVGRVAGATNPHGAIEVTVTQQTAARFGLRAGSLVTVQGPSRPVLLLVTAVVRERDPAGTFWTADPLAAAPELTQDVTRDQYSLQGAVLAGPGQLAAIQSAFCPVLGVSWDTMQLDWEFPVDVGAVTADQAQAFVNDLSTATNSPYTQMGAAAPDLAVTEPMTSTLTAFIDAQAAVLAVLLRRDQPVASARSHRPATRAVNPLGPGTTGERILPRVVRVPGHPGHDQDPGGQREQEQREHHEPACVRVGDRLGRFAARGAGRARQVGHQSVDLPLGLRGQR